MSLNGVRLADHLDELRNARAEAGAVSQELAKCIL
jgi:hypothetical protein